MRSAGAGWRPQEGGHGLLVADSPQGLGRGAAVVRRRVLSSNSIKRFTAARSRQRPAEWIAAWRTDSSGLQSKGWTCSRALEWSMRASVQTIFRCKTGDLFAALTCRIVGRL